MTKEPTMNENELNEIISAFTGNLKDDIDTFFSIEKKYNCSPDANTIFNKCLRLLITEMNDDQKEWFFGQLKAVGLGKYIKPAEPIGLNSLSDSEAIMIKKMIIDGGKNAKHKPLHFDSAVLKGKPLVMSVPKNLVEQIKANRKTYLDSHKEDQDE